MKEAANTKAVSAHYVPWEGTAASVLWRKGWNLVLQSRSFKECKKIEKKVLTESKKGDIINKLSRTTADRNLTTEQ